MKLVLISNFELLKIFKMFFEKSNISEISNHLIIKFFFIYQRKLSLLKKEIKEFLSGNSLRNKSFMSGSKYSHWAIFFELKFVLVSKKFERDKINNNLI